MAQEYWWPRRKFEEFLAPASDGSKASLFWLFVVALAFVAVIFGVAVIWQPGTNGGTFGDFIGGTLNPILTFITFMAVLITIVLQQKELADTRDELAKSATALENQIKSLDRQNFESTFFQMLNLHNDIVASLEKREGNTIFKGRDVIKRAHEIFSAQWGVHKQSDEENLAHGYDQFWRVFQPVLAHYFRYLYNMIRFIDESDVPHQRYMRLVRAQLSDHEVALLFYTSMFPRGERFRKYIEEFALFDNLPENLLFTPGHRAKYSEAAYSDTEQSEANTA